MPDKILDRPEIITNKVHELSSDEKTKISNAFKEFRDRIYNKYLAE